MSRNHKKLARRGNRRLVKVISFSGIVALLAMVYLVLSIRCDAIGKEIKELENRKAELVKRLANEERKWSMALGVKNVERLMGEHGIQMGWPAERDIIRLAARPVDAVYAAHNPAEGAPVAVQ